MFTFQKSKHVRSPSAQRANSLNLVIYKKMNCQNKVGVAEDIGCKNDVALSKVGQIGLRIVKNHVPGWMVVHGCMEIIAI